MTKVRVFVIRIRYSRATNTKVKSKQSIQADCDFKSAKIVAVVFDSAGIFLAVMNFEIFLEN